MSCLTLLRPRQKEQVATAGSTPSPSAFASLFQALLEEHDRQIKAARHGTEIDKGSRFRELVESLVDDHEQKLGAAKAERAKSTARRQLSEEDALWKIWDSSLPRIDGPEYQELQRRADHCREKNDAIDADVLKIKAARQFHESGMLEPLGELEWTAWDQAQANRLQKQVAEHMYATEAANDKLATVRYAQILNIEHIRELKTAMWRIMTADRVNTKVQALELDIRSGAGSWWEGSQSRNFMCLQDELIKEQSATMAVVEASRQRQVELNEHMKELEAKQGKLQKDVWQVQDKEQEVWLHLMKDTFETQVIAWRRSNVRSKQLCILQERWKITSACTMFQRQADVERALRSRNAEALRTQHVKLVALRASLQTQTGSIKQKCDLTLSQATQVQAELRNAKYAHCPDTGSLRDRNLLLLYALRVEAIRLAWLEKEHLQTVELAGLINWAAADAGIKLPDIEQKHSL